MTAVNHETLLLYLFNAHLKAPTVEEYEMRNCVHRNHEYQRIWTMGEENSLYLYVSRDHLLLEKSMYEVNVKKVQFC